MASLVGGRMCVGGVWVVGRGGGGVVVVGQEGEGQVGTSLCARCENAMLQWLG